MENKWDLFISHASEDKKPIVAPLANVLIGFGVKVWYDDFSLSIGDSLSRSIDMGLAKSNFGLVILSPAFLSKRWPEYELRGLIAKEISGIKVIIPVWHKLDLGDLLKYSPSLADKIAIRTDNNSILQIALEIIEVVRPDILSRIHSRIAYKMSSAKVHVMVSELDNIIKKIPPIRHDELSPDLIRRIRLIRAALLPYRPLTMKSWIDGFQRDAHPSREVAIWERIATVVLEYCRVTPHTLEQGKSVLNIALYLSLGIPKEELTSVANGLPEGTLDLLDKMYRYSFPIIELKEDEYEIESRIEADKKTDSLLDKEHFPHDVPDDLVDQIIRELEESNNT